MPKQYPFITVEGLEGSSKSTSIKTIERIVSSRFPVTLSREPGGTPLAETLRNIVKQVNHNETISGTTEMLLFSAARMQLFDNIIVPSLKDHCVIVDRSWLSTFAYQCYGRRTMTAEEFGTLYNLTMKRYRPYDLVIYLDIPPAVGLKRARQRGALDRIEQEEISFFERAREGYHSLSKRLPQMVTIDANRDLDSVQADVSRTVERFLRLWSGPVMTHPEFT